MKTKIDSVNIENTSIGVSVQAIKDGEELGNKAILMSEFEAMMYIHQNYELPKEDNQ